MKKKRCVWWLNVWWRRQKDLLTLILVNFFYESVRGKKVTFAGVKFKIKTLIGFFFSWNLHFMKFTHSFVQIFIYFNTLTFYFRCLVWNTETSTTTECLLKTLPESLSRQTSSDLCWPTTHMVRSSFMYFCSSHVKKWILKKENDASNMKWKGI